MNTSETTPPTFETLDRYLRGEASDADRACVRAWIAEDPERRARVVEAAALVQRPQGTSTDGVLEIISRRITEIERLGETTESSDGVRRVGGIFSPRPGFFAERSLGLGAQTLHGWRWLAGGVAAAVLVWGIMHPHVPSRQGTTRTFATGPGQVATVTLSDGSRATLSANTTIRLRDFGVRSRTVDLSGEAYFDVLTASGAPFVVRSGNVTTRVLGTTFIVRHRPDDPYVRVAVAKGKVQAISGVRSSAGAILEAGFVGNLTDSSVRVDRLDTLAAPAEWIDGRLVFRNAPVALVLQTLSRWYGYQFRYAEPDLASRKVNVLMNLRSSAEAFATLEPILEVNFTVAGDTVTVTPQPVRPARKHMRTYDVWTPSREVGR